MYQQYNTDDYISEAYLELGEGFTMAEYARRAATIAYYDSKRQSTEIATDDNTLEASVRYHTPEAGLRRLLSSELKAELNDAYNALSTAEQSALSAYIVSGKDSSRATRYRAGQAIRARLATKGYNGVVETNAYQHSHVELKSVSSSTRARRAKVELIKACIRVVGIDTTNQEAYKHTFKSNLDLY